MLCLQTENNYLCILKHNGMTHIKTALQPNFETQKTPEFAE